MTAQELPQQQTEKPSVLIVEMKKEDKARYVQQAQRRGMKVGAWVQAVLSAALDDDLRPPGR